VRLVIGNIALPLVQLGLGVGTRREPSRILFRVVVDLDPGRFEPGPANQIEEWKQGQVDHSIPGAGLQVSFVVDVVGRLRHGVVLELKDPTPFLIEWSVEAAVIAEIAE